MTGHPLRIVAHNGGSLWGGGQIAQTALLEGLGRRGHRVVLYCSHEAVGEEAAARGVETRLLPLRGDFAVHQSLRFARALRQEKPDVLMIGLYRKLWLAGLGARLAAVPRVVARIDISSDVPQSLKYRFILRNWVDAIVLVADEIRELYIGADIDPERLITIHNGLESDRRVREPGVVRRSLGIPPTAGVVGGIGRLCGQKRFDRLLEGLPQLPGDVHCLIAGVGDKRAELEALAAELGVVDRVHLLGFRRDIPDVLEAMDVLVVSSDYEGLAMVMTEAMAAGVPVVSTPVSGAREALQTGAGENPPGMIVGFDSADIARAVGQLLSDPERRHAMGQAGRRRVQEEFSYERMLDRWEAVLAGNDLSANS